MSQDSNAEVLDVCLWNVCYPSSELAVYQSNRLSMLLTLSLLEGAACYGMIRTGITHK